MQLISINVSPPRVLPVPGRPIRTGIYKRAVEGSVRLTKLRVEGDAQADLSVHGGLNKAVYVYAHDHYAYWSERLGREDFEFGQFGENFTVERALEDQIHVGDTFRAGSALLQATNLRQPCFKIAFKMGMEDFPKMFLQSGRLGFYNRVLEEGESRAGDAFEIETPDPAQVSIADLARAMFWEKENFTLARRILAVESLEPSLRNEFQQRLLKAGEAL